MENNAPTARSLSDRFYGARAMSRT